MQLDAPTAPLETALDIPERSGRPMLTIEREDRTVLDASPIGIETYNQRFVEDLSLTRVECGSVDRQYQTPVGKRREHGYHANEATLALTNEAGDAVEMDLRISDDAVAYRYRFPGSGPVVVTDETGTFTLPSDATAWMMPFEKKHEGVFRETTATETDGRYGYPALFEVGDDWLFITETDVDGRYCASQLETEASEIRFDLRFPDDPDYRNGTGKDEVSGQRPLATPWRVAIVGDLGTVVESDVVTSLVDPNARGNTPEQVVDDDWIEPGRVAWSWWSDGESPSDFDRQREFVDYAAERGWEYVLVDEGWSSEWMADLVDYATERNVGIFVWSRWSRLKTPSKRAVRLEQWADFGVDGVKVDFMNADHQSMMTFYDDLAAATAEHGLLLNVHGSIPPKGLRRQWPHLLTYEGVHGAENYHPVPETIDPSHNVVLPFTRNVLGPMDYTPVTFSAETRRTSVGHELALSVVFESGLQHFADSIEQYAERPDAEWFLERVPVAWDETRFIGGRPADRATIARRRGDDWHLGTIVAGEGRTIDCPLSFLGDGTYDVTLVRERDGGETLVSETRSMTAEETLTVPVAENGGFVLRCVPI